MTIYRASAVGREFLGTFTTASTTYVDLLDQAAGATFSLSFTKSAGTDLLVIGNTTFFVSGANCDCNVAVNDGTTDWFIGRGRANTTSSRRNQASGAVLVTGLGAGTYTLKLRVKTTNGAGTLNFSASEAASFNVIECGTGFVNAACNTLVPAVQQVTSAVNINMVDSATPITVAITKRSAGNKLLVFARCEYVYAVNSGTPTMGVNDGTTDTDVGQEQGNTTGYGEPMGMVFLTGHAAGLVTLTGRIRGTNANRFDIGSANSVTIAIIEVP